MDCFLSFFTFDSSNRAFVGNALGPIANITRPRNFQFAFYYTAAGSVEQLDSKDISRQIGTMTATPCGHQMLLVHTSRGRALRRETTK